MSVDRVRLLLKHRLGLRMPPRDHESVLYGTTSHGTHVRQTMQCTAYAPQMYGGRSNVSAKYTGASMFGVFLD